MAVTASREAGDSASPSSPSTINAMPGMKDRPVQSFDYVIVGGGPSAMGLLYGMLEPYAGTSKAPPFKVAVVERGSMKTPQEHSLTQHVTTWSAAANLPHSILFPRTPSPPHYPAQYIVDTYFAHRYNICLGQGLGGSSNVNAAIAAPPKASDFEHWAGSWTTDMMQGSKHVLSTMTNNNCIHQGKANDEAYFDCAVFKEKAFDLYTDIMHTSVKDEHGQFQRRNYYQALVQPLLDANPHLKPHVQWFLSTEAQRIVVSTDGDAKQVESLECCTTEKNGDKHSFSLLAKKELILCAGALESPALMLVSGMGQTVRGIGKNLQDQALVGYLFGLSQKKKLSFVSPSSMVAMGHIAVGGEKDCVVMVAESSGLSQINSLVISNLFRIVVPLSGPAEAIIEGFLEIFARVASKAIYLALEYSLLGYFMYRYSTIALICQCYPKSKGSLNVERLNPEQTGPLRRRDVKINAHVGYLEDERDIDALWEASKMCRKSANDNGCTDLSSKTLESRSVFGNLARGTGACYYHYSGTCRMRKAGENDDGDWVVDEDLRVRDHSGIRVCDASTFSRCISVPPSLTCATLGYEFSRRLLMNKGKGSD